MTALPPSGPMSTELHGSLPRVQAAFSCEGVPVSEDAWTALADHWWEHNRLSTGTRAERKALSMGEPHGPARAGDHVRDVIQRGGPEALALLRALAQRTPAGAFIGDVGAGPVEDLVHEHGEQGAALIAAAAREDRTFARAVAGMWMPSGLSERGREILEPWICPPPPHPALGARDASDPGTGGAHRPDRRTSATRPRPGRRRR